MCGAMTRISSRITSLRRKIRRNDSTPFYPIEIGFSPEFIEFYAESYYQFFTISVLRGILQENEAKLEMKIFNPPSIFVWG